MFLFSYFLASKAGLVWGVMFTSITIILIILLIVYYRRRVANLKAEINHVVKYMSDGPAPGHFDNPVYSYQNSVQSDTSTLLNRGGMNNLQQTKPSNIDRLNNFNDESNLNSRATTYSLKYDPELMNQKNFQADMTNPNLYHSIEDVSKDYHLYDEIKNKDGYKDIGSYFC